MKQFKCIAHIRKNATGEVRSKPSVEFGDDGNDDPGFFTWQEGNFACDCNRELFFERIDGKEISHEQCSEGRFSVNLENEAGKIYYREFPA